MSTPTDLEPQNHGWKLVGTNQLSINWFNGPRCPDSVVVDDSGAQTDDEETD